LGSALGDEVKSSETLERERMELLLRKREERYLRTVLVLVLVLVLEGR
jgi:hypothetical protein